MRNLVLFLAVALASNAAADPWPGGVTPQPNPFGAPAYNIVFGPQTIDHGSTMQTVLGGSISNCPGWWEMTSGGPLYHDFTHTSVRPDLTFAGKFTDLTYSHASSGAYYNYSSGAWHATDYTPAGAPGGGDN